MFFLSVTLKVWHPTEKNLAQLSFSWDKTVVCSSAHLFDISGVRDYKIKASAQLIKKGKDVLLIT